MQTFELKLRCSEIKNMQDAMMIQHALASSPGIDRVEVNVERHELFVTTVNQDGGDDVIRSLDNAGFACVRAGNA